MSKIVRLGHFLAENSGFFIELYSKLAAFCTDLVYPKNTPVFSDYESVFLPVAGIKLRNS